MKRADGPPRWCRAAIAEAIERVAKLYAETAARRRASRQP